MLISPKKFDREKKFCNKNIQLKNRKKAKIFGFFDILQILLIISNNIKTQHLFVLCFFYFQQIYYILLISKNFILKIHFYVF